MHVGDTFTARAGLLSVEFRVEEIRVSAGGGEGDEGDEGDDEGENGVPADYCVVTDDTVIDCEGDARRWVLDRTAPGGARGASRAVLWSPRLCHGT